MKTEIDHLTKVYRGDVRALDDLSLVIPHGMFGLLGPNGAGKTTLTRILAGILHPTSGTVQVGRYDGTREQGRAAIKQMLGYLPQELGMYPDLSAREFLDYVGLLKGLKDRKQRKPRVEELLEMVGLATAARRKIKTFSGGMKRRLGIAQALINDPQLLIVDEPTAGLDPEERIRFRNLLSNLRIVASTSTRLHHFCGTDLQPGDIERWYVLRDELDMRQHSRRVQTRFRRDPDAYLADLENKLLLLRLPP